MVKKPIAIILILAFFLSLIPNFLYNGSKGTFASEEDPCEDAPCYPDLGCNKAVYDEESETCVCINCKISCPWAGGIVTNKSCLPLSGTGEWDCGVEIPIGEVVDNTTFLAEKMLAETLGIIKGGRQMVDKTDELLTDYKKWNCGNKEVSCEDRDWNCGVWCQCAPGCYKYYHITKGKIQAGEHCPDEIDVNLYLYAGDGCNTCKASDCSNKCESCEQCGETKTCCWSERYCWDIEKEKIISCPTEPEKGIETLDCKYCPKEKPYCEEECRALPCLGLNQYFGPILDDGYPAVENLQKALKNDIEEENVPEKFKRSYILEQLEFSRCELAQCWMSAEEYPAVLEGEKVGKHLLTCTAVSQMEFLEEDQINCLSYQIKGELEDIKAMWEEPTENWWKWAIASWYISWKIVKIDWMAIWGIIKERSEAGQEEGCYPHNFYCCQK